MPKVSVVIPNYKHEKFIKQRIESVLQQSYQDFEIIILDDCSTDNSRNIIEIFRGNEKIKKIIYNKLNSGSPFKQWKKGIELSSGEYIWIAESDDYADKMLLETLMEPFLADSDVVISFCRSVHVDEQGRNLGLTLHADQLDATKWKKDYIVEGSVELDKYLKYRNTIPNASAVLFKKPKDLKNVLSIQLKFTGDWLFWKNLLKDSKGKIAYSAKPLNFFRTHAKTTRDLTVKSTLQIEIGRFKEYQSFVPFLYLNPLDDRYRWMMAEWIDRGVESLAKNTRYQYFPLLHPSLVIRYYIHRLKKLVNSIIR